ncbi:MAG TPA: hypothetical protein VGN26_08480 [Armatimonadota bacterium]|jgi:hypothetical protein
MSRYFIAANLWLLFAAVLFLGRNVARSQPTFYSFFGVGGWLSPMEYNLGIVAAVVVAAFFFFRDAEARDRERRAERRGDPTRRG